MIDGFGVCVTFIVLVAGKILTQYFTLKRVVGFEVASELIEVEYSLRFISNVSNSQGLDVLRNS